MIPPRRAEREIQVLQLPGEAGQTIPVLRAEHPRARRLRLTVTAEGARLSCPPRTPPAKIDAFLRQHAEWIKRQLDRSRPDAPPLQPGQPTQIPLRGQPTPLRWREGRFPGIELIDDHLLLTLPEPLGTRPLATARALLHGFLQAQIRREVSQHLARYVPALGKAPTGVRIRPLKSLWGSLDTRDAITLDLSLALAPPEALAYVTIHELCHLHHRNHGAHFWARVESLCPHWRQQRDWLREHGHALKAELARLVRA